MKHVLGVLPLVLHDIHDHQVHHALLHDIHDLQVHHVLLRHVIQGIRNLQKPPAAVRSLHWPHVTSLFPHCFPKPPEAFFCLPGPRLASQDLPGTENASS